MPRPSDAMSRVALPVSAIAAAWAAAWLWPGPFGPQTTVALLLAGAAGVLGAITLSRGRESAALRELRQQHLLLGQQLDTWIWLTDAEHRLVRFQPPHGAPTSSWVEGASGGELLWQRFDDDAHTLRARLEARAPLHDLTVVRAAEPPARRWRMRGLPRLDAEGRFAGYIGLATPLQATAPPTLTTTIATLAPPSDAGALSEEQAAFAYTISHDLRAPIRIVEGFARILKEDYGTTLDRIGNDHLDRVLAAAARMQAMIDAMLSLSRLSTQPLARVVVDLSQIGTQVADELRRGAPHRDADIRIQAGLGAVGDPALLRIVVENLLGNAWKYTAKARRAEIDFEQAETGSGTVFVVRDNGVGFDMQHADRLFGMFCRLHGSSEFPGHGIGLASVRRIVRRHGGDIRAEAEPGRGARFYFTLGH